MVPIIFGTAGMISSAISVASSPCPLPRRRPVRRHRPPGHRRRLLRLLLRAKNQLLRIAFERFEDAADIGNGLTGVDRQLLVLLQAIAGEAHDTSRDLLGADVE